MKNKTNVFTYPVKVVELPRSLGGAIVSRTPDGLQVVLADGRSVVIPWERVHEYAEATSIEIGVKE